MSKSSGRQDTPPGPISAASFTVKHYQAEVISTIGAGPRAEDMARPELARQIKEQTGVEVDSSRLKIDWHFEAHHLYGDRWLGVSEGVVMDPSRLSLNEVIGGTSANEDK